MMQKSMEVLLSVTMHKSMTMQKSVAVRLSVEELTSLAMRKLKTELTISSSRTFGVVGVTSPGLVLTTSGKLDVSMALAKNS